MSARDLSEQLSRIVEKAIEEHELEKFEDYWELFEATANIKEVQAFFLRTEVYRDTVLIMGEAAYCNLAIIGDGLLIDIEGDDSDGTGSLTFHSLASVSGVSIHAEPLQNLPSSRGASLVVLANRAGEEDVGLHWVAKTEEEEERLLRFAEALVEALSKTQGFQGV